MKKLELVGIVLAAAAVIFGVLNDGTDATGAIAFTPVMVLAALQYAPYEGAWQIARGFTICVAIICGMVALLGFGMIAGMLHDVLPTHLLVGHAVAALCGLVIFYGLLEGGSEILHTGVYRYAHAHTRS